MSCSASLTGPVPGGAVPVMTDQRTMTPVNGATSPPVAWWLATISSWPTVQTRVPGSSDWNSHTESFAEVPRLLPTATAPAEGEVMSIALETRPRTASAVANRCTDLDDIIFRTISRLPGMGLSGGSSVDQGALETFQRP